MFKIPMIVVGLGAALALSLAGKSAGSQPRPFTATYRRQVVYEGAARKFVAPKVQRKPPSTEVRVHLTKSPETLEP